MENKKDLSPFNETGLFVNENPAIVAGFKKG